MLVKGIYYIIVTIKIAYTITEATRVHCQGRIQELKKGGSFERVRAQSAPKNLGDHAHFCQTTPILIKTRLRGLN